MSDLRPDFRRPPIREQAISFCFNPVPGFGLIDVGLCWQEFSAEFPTADHADRIERSIEIVSDDITTSAFRVKLPQAEVPRAIWSNVAGELIQLQDDRFAFNWRRVGDDVYPHWETTTGRFGILYERFCGFLANRGLPAPAVNQCEVTNLNIILVDEFGSDFADLTKALNVDPLDMGVEFLRAETYVRNRQHLILNEYDIGVGRLHTAIAPVVENETGHKAFRLELTARSTPDLSGVAAAQAFLATARNAINTAFVKITNPELQEKWRVG
jgi:uncharacterized protein (TIGR04255 family)